MIGDLSPHHQLITSLFKLPISTGELTAYRLSDEQVAFYREHGYVAGIPMLTDEQVEVLREELAQLTDPSHEGHHLFYEYHSNESPDPATTLFHALGAWRIAPGFHDLLWNPAFTVPASQLLEAPVRFWHDQLFCKPAHHGGVVAWHQDYSYWTRTKPMAVVFRDGVKSASDAPLLEGVPPIPVGEVMGGQFFPVLFGPQAPGVG